MCAQQAVEILAEARIRDWQTTNGCWRNGLDDEQAAQAQDAERCQ